MVAMTMMRISPKKPTIPKTTPDAVLFWRKPVFVSASTGELWNGEGDASVVVVDTPFEVVV